MRWVESLAPAVLILLLTACGAPARPGDSEASGTGSPNTPKRAAAVVRGDVPTLVPSAAGPVPGLQELGEMLNPGLVTFGAGGRIEPRLASTVPSIENGLWKVFPDGQMELTWPLRPDVLWHDGEPFTADDVIFRQMLDLDNRMPFANRPEWRSLAGMDVVDPHTILMRWRAVYLYADTVFASSASGDFLLPKHLLEPVYSAGDTERFLALPYWTTEFVGTGAYKVREWTHGSGVVLDANDRYFLGRPKIDVLEIKFILDPNTIAANILAGEVDVTLGGRLPLDWAEEIRDRSAGKASFGTSVANPMVLYINQFNPIPPAIQQVEFRRALLEAIDRQTLMDALVAGRTEIAHATVLGPGRIDEFRALDLSVVKYAYDPARAAGRIEALGYQKGPDGIYHDDAGQRLDLEIRTTQGDIQQEHSMYSTGEYWQRIGLGFAPVVVPSARRGDDEYRATFPGFDLRRNPHRPNTLRQYFHSANAPFPERSYRGGAIERYVNPELDRLIDLHDSTVPTQQRWEILGRIVHLITDQVVVIGLFYDVEVTVMTTRMKNVLTRGDQQGEAWNAHEWDVAN